MFFSENLIHGKKILSDVLKLPSAEQCLFLGDLFFKCLYLQVQFHWLLNINDRYFSTHY